MGKEAIKDISRIFSGGDRHLLLLPVVLLNLLPALLDSLSKPEEFTELVLFTLAASASILLYIFWLSKQEAQWAKVVVLLTGFALTAWYTLLLLDVIPDAYLGFVVLVQLIFLLLGPRYGMAMLGIVMAADVLFIALIPNTNILSSIFSLTVLVTVGLLSWVFVSTANGMRVKAERAAAEAHEAMAEAQRLAAEVTNLNRLLLSSQDRERQRLARDIHDGPLQSMGVELLAVDRTKRRLETGDYDKAGLELEYLRGIVSETVDDLRDTVNALRNTLLDSGIEPALRNLARRTQEATGLSLDTVIDLRPDEELPEALATCIYQLAVEALNNIKKHARAHNAVLTLEDTHEQVKLTISDDGRGFDYEAALDQAMNGRHIGLYSMTERADEFGGTLAVTSSPGQGTTLTFIFPRPLRSSRITSHLSGVLA
jgi:signal transduction histidine kinase